MPDHFDALMNRRFPHRRSCDRRAPNRRLSFQSLSQRQLLAADLGSADLESADPAQDRLGSPEGEFPNSVYFSFDYSRDNGFFSGANQFRRGLLEQAGEFLTDRLGDQLEAIPASSTQYPWSANFANPSIDPTSNRSTPLPNGFSVAANEIVVFVGSADLSAFGLDTRARASVPPTNPIPGCALADAACFEVRDQFRSRGQAPTTNQIENDASEAIDFAPIYASISFDNRPETLAEWNFEDASLDERQFRFLSFAIHELGHVLGIGISPSFVNQANGGIVSQPGAARIQFENANQVYLGSGSLPLNGGHLATSVLDVQPTLMTETVTNDLFSPLDFAVLDDIGWEIKADDRPTVSLQNTSAVVLETTGDGSPQRVEISATLSSPSTTAIQVPVSLSGDPVLGTDFTLSRSDFRFEANATTASILIEVLDDDIDETIEALTLQLNDVASVILGTDRSFRLAIFDDDGIDLTNIPTVDQQSVGGTFTVAGNNQPVAIPFRASRSRTLQVSARGVDQISEAVILVDPRGNPIGNPTLTGIESANLQTGESYALVFYPRLAERTFDLVSPGGFAALAASTRTNVLFPVDVNGSGDASATDALQIINLLNSIGTGFNVDQLPTDDPGLYDVSGDGTISPVDALQIINFLNRRPAPTSEPILVADDKQNQLDAGSIELFDAAIAEISLEKKLASF